MTAGAVRHPVVRPATRQAGSGADYVGSSASGVRADAAPALPSDVKFCCACWVLEGRMTDATTTLEGLPVCAECKTTFQQKPKPFRKYVSVRRQVVGSST